MTVVPTSPLANLTAQWFNTVAAALHLSTEELQLAQGSVIVPANTMLLWNLMDNVPAPTVAQVYTGNPLVTLSSEYMAVLASVGTSGGGNFATAMGLDNLQEWSAAKQLFMRSDTTIFSDMPDSLNVALSRFFEEWAAQHLDPNLASKCFALYRASMEDPIYVAQELSLNLATGGEVAHTITFEELKENIKHAPMVSFSMDSNTASSSLDNSWASSSSSTGGSYFYSTSSSSESTDFTQTYASSQVTIEVSYLHQLTVPVAPLSSGSVSDNGTAYLPWYYPAALTDAYENTAIWTGGSAQTWADFFSSTGSLQYAITQLVVVDGITTTTTSMASYSTAEQTFQETTTSGGYGCWPYYVTNSSDNKTQNSSTFNTSGQLVTTTTSAPGNPVIIGFLVSSIKDLVEQYT